MWEMAYEYGFKHPREKLHEIVSRYLVQMHTLGRAPNCGVSFCAARFARADVPGWLLRRDDGGRDGRYVLLEDGDVWLEACDGCEEHQGDGGWLTVPSDELSVLLARSLRSARSGGDALLAMGEAAANRVVVGDRRCGAQAFAGREKRD